MDRGAKKVARFGHRIVKPERPGGRDIRGVLDDRVDRHASRGLSGLMPTHSIRNNTESKLLIDAVAVLVGRSSLAPVRAPVRMQHRWFLNHVHKNSRNLSAVLRRSSSKAAPPFGPIARAVRAPSSAGRSPESCPE